MISVDTSAMHIAAAFKIPVVALFGEGNPYVWKPYSQNSRFIFKEKGDCSSCRKWFNVDKMKHECMEAIQVEEVLETVYGLWK